MLAAIFFSLAVISAIFCVWLWRRIPQTRGVNDQITVIEPVPKLPKSSDIVYLKPYNSKYRREFKRFHSFHLLKKDLALAAPKAAICLVADNETYIAWNTGVCMTVTDLLIDTAVDSKQYYTILALVETLRDFYGEWVSLSKWYQASSTKLSCESSEYGLLKSLANSQEIG